MHRLQKNRSQAGLPRGRAAGKAVNTEDEDRIAETIRLQETYTQTIISLPSMTVAMDARERVSVENRNTAYQVMVEARLSSADRYGNRHTQTINFCQKNKEVQAPRPPARECGSQASTFDIYDEYSRRNDANNDVDGADLGSSPDGQMSSAANGSSGLNASERKMAEFVKVSRVSFMAGGRRPTQHNSTCHAGGPRFARLPVGSGRQIALRRWRVP
jgi:hypothetical protein